MALPAIVVTGNQRAFIRWYSGAGALDRRGTGDVWTMTVEEYLKASRWKRFSYRLAGLPSLTLRLWDEKLGKLVGFRHLKNQRRNHTAGRKGA